VCSDRPAKRGTDRGVGADAGITRLLDAYDLPFIPTMFLYEKKAIYLRFVGASRALMHRVLDEQVGGLTG